MNDSASISHRARNAHLTAPLTLHTNSRKPGVLHFFPCLHASCEFTFPSKDTTNGSHGVDDHCI